MPLVALGDQENAVSGAGGFGICRQWRSEIRKMPLVAPEDSEYAASGVRKLEIRKLPKITHIMDMIALAQYCTIAQKEEHRGAKSLNLCNRQSNPESHFAEIQLQQPIDCEVFPSVIIYAHIVMSDRTGKKIS